jgi:rRNA small subunit pseudouridine methyltransferase Nep1
LVLTLVLAESSIELVPREIVKHPAVLNWARRKKKDPGQLILDQTYHYPAMKRLGIEPQRGRPDISHLCLLAALGSPLNLNGELSCLVHTRDNKLVRVDPKTRLPRNTDRFVALLEQLYEQGAVPKSGPHLLTLERASLGNLVSVLDSDSVVALTTQGKSMPMHAVAGELAQKKKPVLLVGGFSDGHFSKQALDLATEAYKINQRGLDAWTVVARAVYDYERAIGMGED